MYEAFNRFVASMVPDGVLITCADDAGAVSLAQRSRAAGLQVLTYGESEDADVRLSQITSHGSQSSSVLAGRLILRGSTIRVSRSSICRFPVSIISSMLRRRLRRRWLLGHAQRMLPVHWAALWARIVGSHCGGEIAGD